MWACRALNGPKRRFPARTVVELSEFLGLIGTPLTPYEGEQVGPRSARSEYTMPHAMLRGGVDQARSRPTARRADGVGLSLVHPSCYTTTDDGH